MEIVKHKYCTYKCTSKCSKCTFFTSCHCFNSITNTVNHRQAIPKHFNLGSNIKVCSKIFLMDFLFFFLSISNLVKEFLFCSLHIFHNVYIITCFYMNATHTRSGSWHRSSLIEYLSWILLFTPAVRFQNVYREKKTIDLLSLLTVSMMKSYNNHITSYYIFPMQWEE